MAPPRRGGGWGSEEVTGSRNLRRRKRNGPTG